ncbi:homoserine dehydrogenase [Criibacterium bergeronii]|uniref:Homoserine dehydrogenase n=1 Tax=Criibacterium bergeronii TaxID=1871336 RepID=A0A552VB78_9FIRM|nr:homoserine dehydrogenase [Criibacterium bergeronii]TRW27737.1 homoserine dehydrogenase [Criibacterium bergeronii]
MTKINVALLGIGTVGKGVYDAIVSSNHYYEKCYGISFNIKKILVSNLKKIREGVDGSLLTDNFEEIINDNSIEIIIEVMGGIDTAKEYILKSFEHKKHIISANKDLISLYRKELEKTALENNCFFRYEASVAGGVPAIDVANYHFAGENITGIDAILNGTTNYILSTMYKSDVKSYDDALQEAKDLGFAEANPKSDVEGLDSARKLAILSSIYYKKDFTSSDVYTQGITQIDTNDIAAAKMLNYSIKLLATSKNDGKNTKLAVYPAFVKEHSPFADIDGGFNIICVQSDLLGKSYYIGAGAGAKPTASAVISNLVNISFKLIQNETPKSIKCSSDYKNILKSDGYISSYYVSIDVKNGLSLSDILKQEFTDFEKKVKAIVKVKAFAAIDNYAIVINEMAEKELKIIFDKLSKIDGIQAKKYIRIHDEL